MYSHASNRDGSLIEDFLSSFAKRLPLKEGEEDPKANKQIDAAIAQIKKLKGADLGDDQSNKEMGELMEAERADATARMGESQDDETPPSVPRRPPRSSNLQPSR